MQTIDDNVCGTNWSIPCQINQKQDEIYMTMSSIIVNNTRDVTGWMKVLGTKKDSHH